MSDLHTKTVLVLNKNWQAFDITTPALAYCQMSTDVATALDISGDGTMTPTKWRHWLNLPVREGDLAVGLSGNRRVRVPTVIVLAKFSKVPVRRPKLTSKNVWSRDGGRCQYTGRKLAPGEGNLDHVLPQSRGGANTWDNLVLADRRVNSRKSNKTPEEAGLTLLRKPEAPPALPSTLSLRNTRGIPDWSLFGIHPEEA